MPPQLSYVRRLFVFASLVLASLCSVTAPGAVVINEVVAGASDRLLQYDPDGVQRVGTGLSWYQPTFDDSKWSTGAGPFGYGSLTSTPTPIATRVEALMRYLTPTLYLRRGFTVSDEDALRQDPVQLLIEYNDGFVAYLNGIEIVRRNAGPSKKFIYHDQPAYNRESFSGTAPIPTNTMNEVLSVGVAASLLKPGNNVLAIHALNANASDATFYVKANLRINGTTVTPLVNFNDPWRYLVGVVEPSGNLYDPALLGTGKLNAPWGRIDFDAATWSSGPGPIGTGSVAGVTPTTSVPGIVGVTPSLYIRTVFTADAAALAETTPMQLVVQYDDGFVAYINGVEVARRRLGTVNTFTPNTAVADSDNTSTPVAETIALDIPTRLLVAGDNVLAIQVHNYSLTSPDVYIRADLRTGAARTLVPTNTTWQYMVGTQEPVPDPTGEEEEATPEGPDSAPDWIELYNNGATEFSLAGYSLTDDPSNPRKWAFPNVSIPAGGYLIVMADGLDLTSNPDGYLHTNFSLDQDGEYLGLYDSSGTPVDQIAPNFPRQFPFHSYARDPEGKWKYSDAPSPGNANGGNYLNGMVATPTVNIPGRFYASPQSVTLSCATPGATIRYTTDGSEPTITSNVASGAVTGSGVLRARAFLNGAMPSDVITHTYLIAQSAARQSLPAVCLSGDLTKTFYRPFGIFAISPNTSTAYTGSIWSQYIGNTSGNLTSPNVPPDPTAYNAPMQSGKPAERPISLEILNSGATQDLRTGAGLRTAGSPYSRPRYVLTSHNSGTPNAQSPWPSTATEKPQLNLFFRDDLGGRPLTYPFVPISSVRTYENLRLRAGKNDISNPFTRDEFSRRLLNDMGQVVVLGDFVTVYLNGVYKGYFNICERPREKFFQEARKTTRKFDVRYITVMTDGDPLAYNEMVNYARTSNPASYASYQGLMNRVDVVNFADYIIFNAYAAMADWPGNNYVMDRERTASGRYRFSIWDGEGGFGGFSRNPAYKNTFTVDLASSNPTGETIPARLLYTQLKKSPEWRLLFADRIQKHLFNNGALDTANFTNRYNELKNKIAPLIGGFNEYLPVWLNGTGDTSRYTLSGGTTGSVVNVPSRRKVLFDGFIDDTAGGASIQGLFVSEGLWPATRAPVFNQLGGNVTPGFQLSVSNPNAGGNIYITTNGADPRAVGGGVAGQVYSAPITINQSTIVKARVLNGATWSPLMEATFTVAQPLPLQLTEIMYNPLGQGALDGDDFEFIELKNVGTETLNLNGMQFTDGIAYTFPDGATLAPGAFMVLAKNSTQFATRYPGVTPGGTYGPTGSLANSGELLTLRDIVGNVVFSVSFSDRSPWPASPDGYGNSLVPINPNANPNVNDPANWRASAAIYGSPGQDDPAPTSPAVLVNEVLTNPGPGDSDAIELYNPTAQNADVSGWFITDSVVAPKKFQIRAAAVVPAGGFLVLRADDLVTPGFALSHDKGEVRLNAADGAGNLTGYSHGCKFFASAPGVSFGRYVNSAGAEKFPPQKQLTLGSANAGPRVGPVVFSEIMYNPGTNGDEFVELRNITGDPIPLSDPADPNNTWRISNLNSAGTDWVCPPGVVLPPRGFAILTEIDPSVFRIKYNVPSTVPVFRYTGALDNSGEQLVLLRPGPAYLNASNIPVIPWIETDSVEYLPFAPWPASSNGTGYSDERINWRAYGDDPGNWRASAAIDGNPGAVSPAPFSTWQSLYFTQAEIGDPTKGAAGADPDGDGFNNLTECALGLDPFRPDQTGVISTSMEMDGSAGPFLTIRFRRSTSAQGFQWLVDTADAPGNWQLNTAVPLGVPVNNGDGTETVARRDTVPSSDATERLIRLRVIGN